MSTVSCHKNGLLESLNTPFELINWIFCFFVLFFFVFCFVFFFCFVFCFVFVFLFLFLVLVFVFVFLFFLFFFVFCKVCGSEEIFFLSIYSHPLELPWYSFTKYIHLLKDCRVYWKEWQIQIPWRYSVQKTLWGCAANMGSKISLLVYVWPLYERQIWYVSETIFLNLPKFEPKLAHI